MCDKIGYHDFFFHKNMQGGDVKRKVVEGLVELSWYLPGGNEKQILQSEICFANLRGDASRFKKQLNVLLRISSIICILLPSECPDQTMQSTILKVITNSKAKIIFIFDEKEKEDTKKYLINLKHEHPENQPLLMEDNKSNEYKFLKTIREKIQKNIRKEKPTPLVELALCIGKYGVKCDLDGDPSHLWFAKNMKTWLKHGIQDAKNSFKLQMHIPKLADLEREKYCVKRRCYKSKSNQSKRDTDDVYRDIETEKKAQKESLAQLDERILYYLHSIVIMDDTERQSVLNTTKHQLDKMSLQNMAKLHQEHSAISTNPPTKWVKIHSGKKGKKLSDKKHSKQLEEVIKKSSFGLELFIRELAQLYQLSDINTYDYAGAAAEMLLSGQVLELLDGDSFYIPLDWFNAVYNKIVCKTNNAKLFVISVLGIQSSGKSTLLNTMFGLEFPVSAGKCTRGAFASLIPLSDSLKTASHFDYLLIVDTEGLTGSADPQLREHENQLSSFVIGVADLAIVNVFGENHNEIKDFLEITVHAFLKMKLVKEKKYCKIVYQNVAAAGATDKLAINRFDLKCDLDKKAKTAATQENCEGIFQKFGDILSFNEEEDVFYIPNLLTGNPLMAPVNPDYGRAVQKVKENIISVMCLKDTFHTSVSQFQERVSNLWKAILKENFIYSFRNTIEVRAFTSLDRKYFDVSVNLMVMGMAELERKIQVALSRCETRKERQEKWDVSKKKYFDKQKQ